MKSNNTYDSLQRRALNVIWTAAEDYSFQPEFTAFTAEGKPDFYMNSIIGYVRKWYDPAVMERLFAAAGEGTFKETYEGLLWIALENCAFLRESRERPPLQELREDHARDFFRWDERKSRQQWMAQNSLLYALEAAKWRQVLGQDPGIVNPWEKRLFQDLLYPAELSSEEIYARTMEIFRRYFNYRKNHLLSGAWRDLRRKLSRKLLRGIPRRLVRSEELSAAKSAVIPGRIAVRQGMETSPRQAQGDSDYRYIRSRFGEPAFAADVCANIDELLCTDSHAGCHLYFTDGKLGEKEVADASARNFLHAAQLQRQKNEEYFLRRRDFCQNSIHNLTQQIRNAMLVYPQPLNIPSRCGRLFPREVWKALKLNDERIFMETTEEEEPDFSVDLLLDASASRLDSQEMISMQGYIIAASLRKCRIPVQVCSFLSLRGYTVLRRFTSYDETSMGREIFSYCAAGWNRDGLAFRGIERLMESSPSANRLLIVLTDASPNDDRRIPADPAAGRFFSLDYSGKAGVEDAAREVQRLRRQGVRVMAILSGGASDAAAGTRIFRQDYVRIEKPDQLSQAAGRLIQQQIQQIHS